MYKVCLLLVSLFIVNCFANPTQNYQCEYRTPKGQHNTLKKHKVTMHWRHPWDKGTNGLAGWYLPHDIGKLKRQCQEKAYSAYEKEKEKIIEARLDKEYEKGNDNFDRRSVKLSDYNVRFKRTSRGCAACYQLDRTD